MIDSHVARRMRQRLLPKSFRCRHNLGNLFRRHLRRGRYRALLEVDNPCRNQLDAISPGLHTRFHALLRRQTILKRLRHECAVAPSMMNRRAGAVDIRHQRPVAARGKLAQRQAHAIFVAGVARGDDSQAHQPLQPLLRMAEQLRRALLQECRPLVRIKFAAFEKEVRVRVRQSRQQRVLGQVVIRRASARHSANLAAENPCPQKESTSCRRQCARRARAKCSRRPAAFLRAARLGAQLSLGQADQSRACFAAVIRNRQAHPLCKYS